MQLIPYKGSAEVVQGLLTGAVDYIVDGIASSLPLIKSGKFRALAKLNSRPLPALPDVQPLVGRRRHAGARRHFELDRLRGAGRHAARRSSTRSSARSRRSMPTRRSTTSSKRPASIAVISTPEEFDAFFRKEAVRWEKAFKESGIKLD